MSLVSFNVTGPNVHARLTPTHLGRVVELARVRVRLLERQQHRALHGLLDPELIHDEFNVGSGCVCGIGVCGGRQSERQVR